MFSYIRGASIHLCGIRFAGLTPLTHQLLLDNIVYFISYLVFWICIVNTINNKSRYILQGKHGSLIYAGYTYRKPEERDLKRGSPRR